MYEDWRRWCRLCGCSNGSKPNATAQFANTDENLSIAIIKYFGIKISQKQSGCNKICFACNEVINSIIKYNNHILKINEMFLDLEKNYFNTNVDLNIIKNKYGLHDELNSLYMHKTISTGWSSQSKTNDQLKNEFVSDIQKCTIKTDSYLNNISDNNDYLESSAAFIDELNDDKSWNEIHTKTEELIGNDLEITETNVVYTSTCIERKEKNITEKNSKNKNLECDICHKIFQTAKGKTIHLKKKHSIKRGPPFLCNTCGRVFKRFQQLNIHESIHLSQKERKYYSCPKCDKKFVSEWYVQDHVRIVHEGDRRFICELCGAAFGTNKNLVDHHLTHSEEKKFQCSNCDKAFKCKRTLKFHVETHDETEYPCDICGLKLNTKRILRRHMLVHSDENKYKCNFCSKEFKRQYEFKNHLLLHTGLKLYQCSFCELTFSNGSNCRKHQKSVHPVELLNPESKTALMIVENVPSFKQLVAANDEVLGKKL